MVKVLTLLAVLISAPAFAEKMVECDATDMMIRWKLSYSLENHAIYLRNASSDAVEMVYGPQTACGRTNAAYTCTHNAFDTLEDESVVYKSAYDSISCTNASGGGVSNGSLSAYIDNDLVGRFACSNYTTMRYDLYLTNCQVTNTR